MRVVGIEDEAFYLPRFKEWAYLANAAGSGRPSREILSRADRAFAEMAAAFLPEIEKRRRAPRDDFVTSLVQAEDNGVKLTDDQLVGELI
ncbi:MAG: cytochrome P450 [Steroidobacteraceae bacterium]|nr:cytochrome P450 [Steroidobacteraceae bacterium]MDW8259879.1 hypothetical protein [Gammaproteobacteria bacterium]